MSPSHKRVHSIRLKEPVTVPEGGEKGFGATSWHGKHGIFAPEFARSFLRRPTAVADYHFDLSKAIPISLPNLRLSIETISLRMPVALLEPIKIGANEKDVSYQSPIKMALAEQF